jgi:hypothetical protein
VNLFSPIAPTIIPRFHPSWVSYPPLAGLPNADGAEVLADLNANAPIRQFAFSKIHHDPLPSLTSHFRRRSATQWSVRDGSTKIIRDLEGRAQAYDLSGAEKRPIPMGAAHQA